MSCTDKFTNNLKISLSVVSDSDWPGDAEKQTPEQIGQTIQRLVALHFPFGKGNRLLLRTQLCDESFEVEEWVFQAEKPGVGQDFDQNYWIESN